MLPALFRTALTRWQFRLSSTQANLPTKTGSLASRLLFQETSGSVAIRIAPTSIRVGAGWLDLGPESKIGKFVYPRIPSSH